MKNITDIHCHILPGIDDGARTAQDSIQLLLASVNQGVNHFIFTPHFYPERMSVDQFFAGRTAAGQQLAAAIQQHGMEKIRYRVGAEIAYTPALAEMPLEKLCFSGTNYLLLELQPMFQPLDVEGLIKRLRKRGYTPILAHIERFPYIEEDPVLLYTWIRAGALAQINAGWALHDRHALKRIEQYGKWNLIHFMASDTHSIEKRPPNLEAGLNALPADLRKKFYHNAQCVFLNKAINREAPIRPVKRFGKWH